MLSYVFPSFADGFSEAMPYCVGEKQTNKSYNTASILFLK
jgi:hypothetical protein